MIIDKQQELIAIYYCDKGITRIYHSVTYKVDMLADDTRELFFCFTSEQMKLKSSNQGKENKYTKSKKDFYLLTSFL